MHWLTWSVCGINTWKLCIIIFLCFFGFPFSFSSCTLFDISLSLTIHTSIEGESFSGTCQFLLPLLSQVKLDNICFLSPTYTIFIIKELLYFTNFSASVTYLCFNPDNVSKRQRFDRCFFESLRDAFCVPFPGILTSKWNCNVRIGAIFWKRDSFLFILDILFRIRTCLTQLYAKDITPDDKQELDEALQREVILHNMCT